MKGVRLGIVLPLLLVIAMPAGGTVICIKRSMTGPLRVRSSCKAKEQQLGSFEALRLFLTALSVENGGATLRLSGLNLQVTSGSGATDGAIDGRGNLIVGYDEPEMV